MSGNQVTRVDAYLFGDWCCIILDLKRKQLNLTRAEGEKMLAAMRDVAPRLPCPVVIKRHHGRAPMSAKYRGMLSVSTPSGTQQTAVAP